MIRLILCGCNGQMGQSVANVVNGGNKFLIAAGIDITTKECGFKVFASPQMCNIKADVILDFSHPSLLPNLLLMATQSQTPVVVCTTGLGEKEMMQLKNASKTTAVFCCTNTSLGVYALKKAAVWLTKMLGKDFDIEIVEKHHNQKKDAPSGTAITLFNAIREVRQDAEAVYDRHMLNEKRVSNEIGIHSVRGGAIAGEHEIVFASGSEIIEIKHTALGKNVFADGALRAAEFIKDKKTGLFGMEDLVEEMLLGVKK